MWKHLNFKKGQLNITFHWGFTVVKSLSGALLKNIYVFPLIFIEFLILTCPLTSRLSCLFWSSCPSWSCGAAEFHQLRSTCHCLETDSSSHTRLGWNIIVKDVGVHFWGAFQVGGAGQDEAIWKNEAVNFPVSEYWLIVYPSLMDCFKV